MKHIATLAVGWLIMLLLAPGETRGQWIEAAIMQASDGADGSYFGSSTAIGGDLAFVGANREGTGGDEVGAVYIFERGANGAWTEIQKLQASDKEAGDRFGGSIAMSGTFLVVGAEREGSFNRLYAGAAYVFERGQDGVWVERQKLQASDRATGDAFGRSVSISGDYAIVGAIHEDTGGASAGAAYVFERSPGGEWIEVQILHPGDPQPGGYFGDTVSVSGDYAIIGAWGVHDGATQKGVAYLFERRPDGEWEEVQRLQASDTETEDLFGFRVAVSGERAVVGAIGEDTGGSRAGAAYVFERTPGGVWMEVQKLQASDRETDDGFGGSIAVSGRRIVVAAVGEDTGGDIAGAAYVFELDEGGNWTEVQKLQASNKRAGAFFGTSVSISENRVIVGADEANAGGDTAGAAYAFEGFPFLITLDRAWIKHGVRKARVSWNPADVGTSQVDVLVDGMKLNTTNNDGRHAQTMPVSQDNFLLWLCEVDNPDGCSNAVTVYFGDNPPPPPPEGDFAVTLDRVKLNRRGEKIAVVSWNPASVASDQVDRWYNDAGPVGPWATPNDGRASIKIEAAGNGPFYVWLCKQGEDVYTGFCSNHIRADFSGVTFDPSEDDEDDGPASKSGSDVPAAYALVGNYPNPFNPSTTLRFEMPERAKVELAVYDVLGRPVRVLVDGIREAGAHEAVFDAGALPSGVYVYRLETPAGGFARSMLLVR